MMNRWLFRYAAFLQLSLTLLMALGCTPMQPFFLNESPNLQHYLDTAAAIEYPDVEVASLAETTEALPPFTLDNAAKESWPLSLQECIAIALHNKKILTTTSGVTELRQGISEQIAGGQTEQFGSIYDVAIQQSTAQSVPLTVDGNGNRVLPRGVTFANQVGGVEDALAEFDAQISGFLSANTTDRVRNVGPGNIFNPQQFQALDTTQQLAISKRLATGGVATLREQIIYSRNNVQTDAVGRQVASDYTAILTAQIQHPLMRNRGTFVNRIPVVLSSLNTDSTLTEFEINVRNLIADVEDAYWDLYLAYYELESSKIARDSAQATAIRLKSQLRGGAESPPVVHQAEAQFHDTQTRVNNALTGSNLSGANRLGVYGSERVLRAKMGLTPTDARIIQPSDRPSQAWIQFAYEAITAEMLHRSPELRRTKIGIQQRKLELAAAKNQILPDVNLSLQVSAVGVGDTLGPPNGSSIRAPNAGSSALGELTSGNYVELGARVDFQPPALGARRELSRVRNSQLRLKKAEAFLRAQEIHQVHLLQDALVKMDTHYKAIGTISQRVFTTLQEVNTRRAAFIGGAEGSDLDAYLRSQTLLANAQQAYVEALTEYQKSITRIHYLKGSLFEYNNVTLGEGPWPKKAYWDALERARERSAGTEFNYGVTRPGVIRRGPVGKPMDLPTGATDSVSPKLLRPEQSIILDATDEVPMKEETMPLGSHPSSSKAVQVGWQTPPADESSSQNLVPVVVAIPDGRSDSTQEVQPASPNAQGNPAPVRRIKVPRTKRPHRY